jgi:hypothetical protein
VTVSVTLGRPTDRAPKLFRLPQYARCFDRPCCLLPCVSAFETVDWAQRSRPSSSVSFRKHAKTELGAPPQAPRAHGRRATATGAPATPRPTARSPTHPPTTPAHARPRLGVLAAPNLPAWTPKITPPISVCSQRPAFTGQLPAGAPSFALAAHPSTLRTPGAPVGASSPRANSKATIQKRAGRLKSSANNPVRARHRPLHQAALCTHGPNPDSPLRPAPLRVMTWNAGRAWS